jgi:multicomponent Na+:H+ antiporter subunit E
VSAGLATPGRWAPAAVLRGCAFLVLWVVLIGVDPGSLVVGLFTASAATWVSLRLLAPGSIPLRPVALPSLAARFAWQSVVAGWDIARRALDPRLPVRPGFVSYPVRFPRGPVRNLFTTLTSLLPGTVPAGEDGDALLYHCLDVERPVAAELAAEEALVSRALVGSSDDD